MKYLCVIVALATCVCTAKQPEETFIDGVKNAIRQGIERSMLPEAEFNDLKRDYVRSFNSPEVAKSIDWMKWTQRMSQCKDPHATRYLYMLPDSVDLTTRQAAKPLDRQDAWCDHHAEHIAKEAVPYVASKQNIPADQGQAMWKQYVGQLTDFYEQQKSQGADVAAERTALDATYQKFGIEGPRRMVITVRENFVHKWAVPGSFVKRREIGDDGKMHDVEKTVTHADYLRDELVAFFQHMVKAQEYDNQAQKTDDLQEKAKLQKEAQIQYLWANGCRREIEGEAAPSIPRLVKNESGCERWNFSEVFGKHMKEVLADCYPDAPYPCAVEEVPQCFFWDALVQNESSKREHARLFCLQKKE